MNTTNRDDVNRQQYSAQDFPKSGFNLSYRSNQSYMIGRLHASGFQHTMPADKFNGSNTGSFVFKRLVSPTVSDVEVCQHNFYLPYRAIDTTFEEAFAPGKMNNMSMSWRTPTFTISALVQATLNALLGSRWKDSSLWTAGIGIFVFDPDEPITRQQHDDIALLFEPVLTHGSADGIESSALYSRAQQLYMSDYLTQDFFDYVQAAWKSVVVGVTPIFMVARLLFKAILTPFVGKRSILPEFGYSYLRDYDFDHIFSVDVLSNFSDYSDFVAELDDIPMCEYAIRAYYAVWYEHYRSQVLEPVSINLPNWKKFGSVSVVEPLLLLVRIRSWQQDLFVDASPDDICRHVFAPIYQPNSKAINYADDQYNYLNAEDATTENSYRNIKTTTLEYLDPVSGTTRSVICPVPALVNDILMAQDTGTDDNPYALDLFNLRKMSMFERYLKRNLAFGDEYKQRMLAHYGSNISDQRINRPQYLSGSVQHIQVGEVIAPVNTPSSAVGERIATARANSSSDGYTFFAEEFGIVINILSFMPKASYAGVCPQNLLSKQIDFPLPEFAANNEECFRTLEIATSGLKKSTTDQLGLFAHTPYAHAYRTRVDMVMGDFLDELQDCTFRRFFGLDAAGTSLPKLNSTFIHCHPNLQMFADAVMFDTQLYGFVDHSFFVERVLPTPVEQI